MRLMRTQYSSTVHTQAATFISECMTYNGGQYSGSDSPDLGTERKMKHHVERTSPKGPGQPFIGTCRLCGKAGLSASAVLEDCENVRGLTAEEAMIETIIGDKNDGM